MFGPVEGRRHDVFLLNQSRLDEHMQLLPPDAYVYGDQAYPLRPWLLAPFKGPNKQIAQHFGLQPPSLDEYFNMHI